MTASSTRDTDREFARRWLVAQGATCDADGVWQDRRLPGHTLTGSQSARWWADMAMETSGARTEETVRVVLGLMDLYDEPGVTVVFSAWVDAYEETREHLWAAYRPRLEAVEEPQGVVESLAHWFEDGFCASSCFQGVLGGEAGSLSDRLRPGVPGRAGLLRRTRRVLTVAGPVPWADLEPVCEAVAEVPELHALLATLLGPDVRGSERSGSR
ncbi:hypothetical protein [Streptomyces gobitricini]|uniref:Uncharacterized protein n=1 Tax=Streptomyces gobitricini TaxID=68211 RepID=A0ABN3MCK7_9ACTN